MTDTRDACQDHTPLTPMEEKIGGLSARDRILKVGWFGFLMGIGLVIMSIYVTLKVPLEFAWIGGILFGLAPVYCAAGTILIVHSRRQNHPEGKLVFFSNLWIIGATLLGGIWGLFGMRWDNFPNFLHFVIASWVIIFFRARLWKWARLRAWLNPTALPQYRGEVVVLSESGDML